MLKSFALFLVLPVIVLISPQSVSAQTLNCADSSNLNQQEMNACAGQEYERTDAALNSTWSLVRRQLDPSQKRPLLDAQRAWINYRDGQCASEGALYEGGSIQPLIVLGCKSRMTQARTQELLLMVQQR